jgi:CRP/FNR family cyclic AMP-dependent transcriptional regulator
MRTLTFAGRPERAGRIMPPQPAKIASDRSLLPVKLAETLFAQARSVKLQPQQMLFSAGDPGDSCALVEEGLLKVHVISPSGGERILAILGPGALVGELSIIDGAPRSASVSALKETTLRVVTRAAFEAITEQQPGVYRHVTAVLARRLRDIDDALTASSFLPLKGRTARALLSLADAFGKDVGNGRTLIHQKVSQTDIAAMAGIARENVSRILQDWTRQGVLSRLAGYYCLEKRDAVERERDVAARRED